MVEKLFFELLQVAIGTRQSLSFAPSADQWSELFVLSKKHTLVAIAFHGLSLLKGGNSAADYFGASLGVDKMTYLKWLGLTAKIAQRNKVMNVECVKVCQEFAHDGLRSVVLKGQSNLIYYPEDLRACRTAGDIDLWCDVPEGVKVAREIGGMIEKREYRGIEGVIEYCKQYERCHRREIPWHRVLYYHCEVTSPSGIGIEPHYRPSCLNSPICNWRLQRWFKENEPWGVCDTKIEDTVFPILPVSTNVVYQILHIYKHLFEEGIGLRQLLDYYFVLRSLHIEQRSLSDRTKSMAQWAEGMGVAVKSNEDIMHILNRFGMKKFAGAVMWVLACVFEPNDNASLRYDDDNDNLCLRDWQKSWPWMICEPNEKEGKFLLNEIMMAGNFGEYDERIKHGGTKTQHAWEKTKHNFRLLTHYPEEVLWEPFFRGYHWMWRRFEWWRL